MGRIGLRLSSMIACCFTFALSMAAGAAENGVIVDYSPPGAMLFLERGGVKQPVRIATLVQAGDKIELPASGTVTIELANSQRLSSSGPGTWEVPVAPALGSIATFFHRLASIMEPDYRLTASAITRGMKLCNRDPILAPVLPQGALVEAGQRGLVLAWKGGCPPYEVELKSDRQTLGIKSGLAAAEVHFEPVSLLAGAYSITIADHTGMHVTLPFNARVEVPAWPAPLAADTSHLGTVARALWLADADGGLWRMDSGELLLPLRLRHDPLAEAAWQEILAQTSSASQLR